MGTPFLLDIPKRCAGRPCNQRLPCWSSREGREEEGREEDARRRPSPSSAHPLLLRLREEEEEGVEMRWGWALLVGHLLR
jgi:hypothetical protein